MSAPRTARQRARAELTAEIIAAARRQVADTGAAALSLRAVARELGMVSSAVYRYFPSRDDLLTTLIVESYAALARTLRAADDPGRLPRDRWLDLCAALRQWALAHPHEYALVYGTPVPGYRAPEATVDPAAQVFLALLAPVRAAAGVPVSASSVVESPAFGSDSAAGVRAGCSTSAGGAHAAGSGSVAGDHADGSSPGCRELSGQVAAVAEQYAPEVPPATLVRFFAALATLFGALNLELFGHLVGSLDPADAFATHLAHDLADRLGLVSGI